MRKIKLLTLLLFMLFSSSIMAQSSRQGLRVGDIAPNFTLTNQNGDKIELDSLVKNGPVVLTWYRGGWCPYCNIALKELSSKINDFKTLGANIVALTPELPDNSLSTSEKNEIKFNILSDIDNNVAKQYDLVFKLDENTKTRYENKFGLSKYNGNNKGELPIPATYIIDQERVIRFAYVNPDYKERAPVQRLLEEVTKLKNETNNNKLVIVWSSDDPMLAKRLVLMYSGAAKRNSWFKEITLVVWGPSAKMIAENEEIQKQVKELEDAGVEIKACIACSSAYGVTDKLKNLGYEVLPMGTPLTNYIKQGYKILTF